MDNYVFSTGGLALVMGKYDHSMPVSLDHQPCPKKNVTLRSSGAHPFADLSCFSGRCAISNASIRTSIMKAEALYNKGMFAMGHGC